MIYSLVAFQLGGCNVRQIADLCVGRSLGAPVSILPVYFWLPWHWHHVFSSMSYKPLILQIWGLTQHEKQRTSFDPTQLQKHFHCHGPHSSPKEGHLLVRQQHSRGGIGVLAASVTWLWQVQCGHSPGVILQAFPPPQVGWALARQRAAVLWSTQVGTQTAAAGIQCRFCALVIASYGTAVGLGLNTSWRLVLHVAKSARALGESRGKLFPLPLSGVRELFVAKFRTSNSYCGNRTARNHHRTVVIFAAWTSCQGNY